MYFSKYLCNLTHTALQLPILIDIKISVYIVIYTNLDLDFPAALPLVACGYTGATEPRIVARALQSLT